MEHIRQFLLFDLCLVQEAARTSKPEGTGCVILNLPDEERGPTSEYL
jgi:hypothetical protein